MTSQHVLAVHDKNSNLSETFYHKLKNVCKMKYEMITLYIYKPI